MADNDELGRSGAHTQAEKVSDAANADDLVGDNGLNAKLEAFSGAVRGDDIDLFALLDQSRESGQQDTLTLMANSVTGPRRARGRPQGSKNLRNTQVFDLLEAQGHRAPEHVLSLIASTDPRVLAVMSRRHKHFMPALDRIIRAASELLPYKLAKRTADVEEPPATARPVIVMNRMNVTNTINAGGARSVSAPLIMQHDVETSTETSD